MSSIGTKLKCPDYGGVLISEGVALCTGFNGVELGPEDVSLLERCPHFRGCCVTCMYRRKWDLASEVTMYIYVPSTDRTLKFLCTCTVHQVWATVQHRVYWTRDTHHQLPFDIYGITGS